MLWRQVRLDEQQPHLVDGFGGLITNQALWRFPEILGAGMRHTVTVRVVDYKARRVGASVNSSGYRFAVTGLYC